MPVLSKIHPVKCWNFANRRRFPVRFPRFTVIFHDFQRNNTQRGDYPNPDAVQKNIGKLVPLEQRLTTPEEIAHTVVFLASFCSSHTTGQLVFVDGGYTHLDRAVGHDHEKW